MATGWCIRPIRWVQQWVVPPKGVEDWQRVSFQPMLYTATWVATIIIVVWGDFSIHPGMMRDDTADFYWVWVCLGLIAPPMGVISLRLITRHPGVWRLRGLWLRLGADVAQFVAMMLYTIVRLQVGDFHIYPVACVFACLLFVFHLDLRDINRLREVEELAGRIHRGEDPHASE